MGKDVPYYYLWRVLEPDLFATPEALQHYPAPGRARYFLRRTKEEMVDYDGRRIYPGRECRTAGYDLTLAEKDL